MQLSKFLKPLFNQRGDIFGGGKQDNQVANVAVPQFQVDPSYTQSQNTLSNLGEGILSGNLPSYYSNIGQANSPAFQGMIKNITGQTQQAAQEQEAAAGTGRSGVGAAASAMALSNVIPGLNYQDFLNAQNQQVGLLNTGIGVEQGVRSAGQAQQGQVNQFGQNIFQDQMQQSEYNNTFNAAQAAQQGQMIGSIIQGGAGLALAPFTGGSSLGMTMSALGGSGSQFSDLIKSLNIGGGGGNGVSGGGIGAGTIDANFGNFGGSGFDSTVGTSVQDLAPDIFSATSSKRYKRNIKLWE